MKANMKAPTTVADNIQYLTSVTAIELKILKTLLWFYKERILGNHKITFPSRETIAEMSNCSLESVRNFIRKYEGIFISHKKRPSGENKRYLTNVYEFNTQFFDFLALFDAAGFLGRMMHAKKWQLKKLKMEIWKLYIDNEDFLLDKLYKNPLTHKAITCGNLSKLPYTESFLLKKRSNFKDLQGANAVNSVEESRQARQDGSGAWKMLHGLRLTFAEMQRLLKIFGEKVIQHMRECFLFVDGGSFRVKNPVNFLFKCGKNYIEKNYFRSS